MARFRTAVAVLVFAALFAACGDSGGVPSGSPIPTGPSLSQAALKLRVLDELPGTIDWCDPDAYPVARGTPLQNARDAFPGMKKDRETYEAVLDHLGIPHDAELTDHELVRVYGAYKLVAHDTPIELADDGGFEVVVRQEGGAYADKVVGHVTPDGQVSIEDVVGGDGSFEPMCPICLARNTRIAVPGGFIRVQSIRTGMVVWSTDAFGHRIRAVVERVGRTPVPPTHRVVRLVLADGRTVLVSPGHPTPAGTPVGDLRSGARFDGSSVISAALVPYAGGFTFDLIPSGPTGTYFANGVLLGSTLDRRSAGHAMNAE